MDDLEQLTTRALAGQPPQGGRQAGPPGQAVRARPPRPAARRGPFVEDGLLANAAAADLPADGVVTGLGRVDGRPVCVMANDPTVKAGSWGARTVEKIVRLTEYALRHELPMFWLVDSAGARITDQVELFPGRRGAGRIFSNQVRLSGKVPQVCCLFGPSAAGGAYIPSFCDVVIMVEGNASMYLGLAAHGRGGDRREGDARGDGRRPHARHRVGLRRQPRRRRRRRDRAGPALFSYLPGSWRDVAAGRRCPSRRRPTLTRGDAARRGGGRLRHAPRASTASSTPASFFEIKPLFAPELIVGFARLDGHAVGVVANNPAQKGGVLFGDSADKAARFMWLCDAFNVPLVFLADVPGFMIGTAGRAPGHHPPRRQDDHRRHRGDRAQDLRHRAQGVRRRPLRDVRAGLRPDRHARPAHGQDRRDGPRGGGQRRVRQQDRRHRGPRASATAFVDRPARRVRGRRRPAAARPASW